MVKDAAVQNRMYLERDILGPSLKILHVQGYEYSGYRARIYDIKSYFDENMRLLCPENVAQLLPTERPVYTKVRDEAPVRYAMDCHGHLAASWRTAASLRARWKIACCSAA